MNDSPAEHQLPREGRLAGIDYGTVRIGVAITDPGQILASPFENYARRGDDLDAKWFCEFADTESVAGFVVGLPIHLSGDESEKSIEARKFGAWLHELTSLPVEFNDERYTSADAEQKMIDAKLTRKRRKQRLDMLAAQQILSTFLHRRSL